MKQYDDFIHLYPKKKKDLFRFAHRIIQEWTFLNQAEIMGLSPASTPEFNALTQVRDTAIRQWNQLALELTGNMFFTVLRRKLLTDDLINFDHDIHFSAGERVLLTHTCYGALIASQKTEQALQEQNSTSPVKVCTSFVLQSVSIDNTLYCIPIEDVINVKISPKPIVPPS